MLYKKLVDSSSFTASIQLPCGIDCNEWIASHTLSIFEGINLICSCLHDSCTQTSCPTMHGPNNMQFHWLDEKGKKLKSSAKQYTELVTSYLHTCANNENIFPTKYGNPFPANFRRTIEHLHRLMSHLFVHIHHVHLSHLRELDLSLHHCTLLYHYLLFNRLFNPSLSTELSLFDYVFKVLEKPDVSDTPTVQHQCDHSANASGKNFGDNHISGCRENEESVLKCESERIERDDVVIDDDGGGVSSSNNGGVKSTNANIPVNKYVPIFTIVT
ncbi:hypothetical protein HELRODRAFT_109762 [Helobdella robusta]|uniref:MOB kinase activator-like 2 n=1 Tax=Helobdella robusta TaxID=6412 RepID=T1EEW3_HELRO|nr:hypothetical protein HELRODRAFT_109762 [Helobdella robusta]ESO09581.1 hypothetical protein HELRODRAFT_109762 [Helobdella robusta]